VGAFTVMNNERPAAILLRTIIDKKQSEDYSTYRQRSLNDLADKIPKEMRDKPLVFVNINQTAIDPDKYEEKELKVLWHGHIAALVAECSGSGDDFKFMQNSLVSKIDKKGGEFFEKLDDYVAHKFIRGEKHTEPASPEYPVKEFMVIIDPEQLGINLDRYLERVRELIEKNEPWNESESA